MRLPAHEATTAQLGAVYPFAATRQLPTNAVLVGRDLLGGLFVHDPFELYRSGTLTNPNMLVLGQIGRGKSAFVKTYLYRQAVFGRRIVVLDPKGEYGPLARALGTEPITLRPGGEFRLNPLDLVSRGPRGVASRSEMALLCELASACLGRALIPGEYAAIELAMDAVRSESSAPTLPAIVAALLEPGPEAAREICSTPSELRSDGRDVGLELRRFVSGELAGMFDGETSNGASLDAPVVVIDLSDVYHSDALGAVVTCVAAALNGAWKNSAQSFLVIDEAWAVLQNPGAARFLQASLKLARSRGVANVVVVHRASDFSAAGSEGSVTRRVAEGLLSDCETLVCYAQADGEIDDAARLFGLSQSEERLLSRLRRGVALWRVGNRSYLVEHRLAPDERTIVDTDDRLVRTDRR